MRLFEFLNEAPTTPVAPAPAAQPAAPSQPAAAAPVAAKPAGQQPFKPNQTMDPQQAAAANKAAQEFMAQITAKLQGLVAAQPTNEQRLTEGYLVDKLKAVLDWVTDALKSNPLIELGLRLLPPTVGVMAIWDCIKALRSGSTTEALQALARAIGGPAGEQLAQAAQGIDIGSAVASGDIAGAAGQAVGAAVPMPKIGEANLVKKAIAETVELNRILKLSGMEFIAEDTTGTQQFVGTGSSDIMSWAQQKALSNATDKLLRQKFGNNFRNQDSPLIYYNQEIKFAADTSKPGNYLATIILTPKEYKLSPGISAKPSMDPNQVLDYFYKGEQIKTTDPFYNKVKQMHIDSLESPAEPATTNETAELSRLSKLISEDSAKSITVQRGDTLGRIAADNSTTVDALVKLNDISNPDRIYPGDVIKIPSGHGDPGGLAKRQGPPSAPDTDTDPNHPSREERALLNMIARRESNGDYNAINYKAKDSLKKGTMQITGDSGHHPFEGQSGTTAAGRYQMLWNTWKTAAKWAGVDPENFSPGNQDLAALALAKWAYKKKYGGDLSKDIKDPKLLAQVIDGLTPWSVKSGGPGFTTQHYASALSDTQAA